MTHHGASDANGNRLTALLRLAVKHGATQLLKIPSQHQVALLWSLKRLMTHPALSCYPFMAEFVFDVTIFLHDSISDDVRQHFTKLDAAKSRDDPRCVFLFGSTPPIDGWLALAKPITGSQPQGQNAEQNSCQETPSQPQTHNRASTANPNPLQRSLSQQHQHQLQAQHAQNTNRMYPQYPTNPQYPPQPQRPWSPYPQMPSAPGQAQSAQQFQQMQRMQQIQQNLAAQQRGMQPSPVQQQQMQQQQQHQRQMAGNPSGAAGMQAAKGGSTAGPASGAAKQEAPEMRTFPFTLKPWEIIPESGKFEAYETFLGMTLFGARKV